MLQGLIPPDLNNIPDNPRIDEDVPIGTSVFDVTVADADSTAWTYSIYQSDPVGAPFEINPVSKYWKDH